MELTRVIHPIGQGGFYTETFTEAGKEVFNVVYDCGSGTAAPKDIISYLEQYYPKNQKKDIDAVFISHLHEDHINGLDWLLKNTMVKRLFLPQLTNDIVIEAFLYNFIKSKKIDNQSNACISLLLQNAYEGTKVYEVLEEFGESVHSIGELNENNIIHSGDILTNKMIAGRDSEKWLYVPFNSPYRIHSGIECDPFFSTAKENGIIDPIKLKDLLRQKGIEDCKKIYERYFGANNHYSMTLFSGMKAPYLLHHCLKPCRCKNNVCSDDCDCLCRDFSPNFLYTGDFEPNKSDQNNVKYVDELMQSFRNMNLWYTIRGVQVPHHGSRNNFSSELYKNRCVGYISAGSHNQFHHPNVDTLVNIQKQGCRPIVVSEDLSSMQVEVYKI